tara:strand:- start:796 stop:996 length:201 start_codon:yes stop_codon:yes gene_type:complete
MTEESAETRIIMAIGRIERALARVETATTARPAASPPSDLARKHEALRKETRGAIGQIDDLLKGLG